MELSAEFYHPFEGVDYTWRRRIFRWLLRTFIFTTLVKIEAEGVENVPREGPTILMVNHTAFLEPVAVAGVVDREDIVPMSKVENFKLPVVSWFVWNWGAFSVQRSGFDRKALEYGIEVLKQGSSVLIMPEGTRRPRLRRAHNGVTYMALKSDAVVVPIGVEGAAKFKYNIRQIKRTELKMCFGRPFRFHNPAGDVDERVPRDALNQMTTEAMHQLALLLPERLRGAYSNVDERSTTYIDFDV